MTERIVAATESEDIRDKRAEVITRFLSIAKGIKQFEGRGLDEVLNTEDGVRGLIERLDANDFLSFINGVNGILRCKAREKWDIDGGEVMLHGFIEEHIPPRQEDKEELLKHAFDEAKRMSKEGRSVEDVAILIAASINEIHPYADANGRTSRFIYTVLTEGFNEKAKETIKNILGELGREVLDINPSIISAQLEYVLASESGLGNPTDNPKGIKTWLNRGSPRGYDDLAFQPEITPELRKNFISALRHDHFGIFLALFEFVKHHPNIERYTKEFPKHTAILINEVVPDLQTADLQRLMDNYWQSKKRYAELLIDCITNPEKPEFQFSKDGETSSCLEIFKAGIKERQQESVEKP